MKRLPLALLAALLMTPACAHPPGPRPSMSDLLASAPRYDGTSVIRFRVRTDFEDLEGRDDAAKVRYMLQALTFTAESPDGQRVDRLKPAVVDGTEEATKLRASFSDRVAMDVVVFPTRWAGEPMRLRAKNVYERPDDEPAYLEVAVPTAKTAPRPPAKMERLTLLEGESKGKVKLEAVLDRDVPVALVAWHYVDGKVYRMDRKGSRLYTREFEPAAQSDHRVFLESTGVWISEPYDPRRTSRGEE